jgi:ABC-2 type transport system permease protein
MPISHIPERRRGHIPERHGGRSLQVIRGNWEIKNDDWLLLWTLIMKEHASQPHTAHPLMQLIIARAREFVREPAAVFWSYVFPLLLVVALGVAFRNRPMEVFRVAVEEGRSADSICGTLNDDKRFQAAVYDEQQCHWRLRTGHADLVVASTTESPERIEYYWDPSKPESVLARNTADDLLQRAAGRQDVVAVENHEVTEPGGRYIDFLVPGMIGMGLMAGGLWGVGFAIVDMRIRKLLKRYLATPMKRSHFMVSIIFSRMLFALPEIALLLLFTWLFFGVSIAGSYLAVALLVVLGALEFSGIGLLVASRALTIESASGLMNAVMLPMYIGSGIFFSSERFPAAVRPVLDILPLTPLIHALRGVMLEGTSLLALGGDVALIVAWGCITFVMALRWFRWS